MIVKKKFNNWINKFKPGVKFKLCDKYDVELNYTNEYTVISSSPWKDEKFFSIKVFVEDKKISKDYKETVYNRNVDFCLSYWKLLDNKSTYTFRIDEIIFL